MDWGYLAGYLDSDGTVYLSEKTHARTIIWASMDRKSLDKMKEFLDREGIKTKLYHSKNGMWTLNVFGRGNIIHLIFMIYKHVILKRKKLEKLYQSCIKSIKHKLFLYWKWQHRWYILEKAKQKTGLSLKELFVKYTGVNYK